MASKRTKKRKKSRVVIKKRFYVICLIFILLLGTGIYFGVKAIGGLIDGGEKETVSAQKQNADEKGEQTVQKKPGDGEDSVTPAVMFREPSADGDDEGETDVPDTLEYQIRDNILASWYISPLGQRRSTIESSFGALSRFEDWNGGIYYHVKFAETMYITYDGQLGEDKLPVADSVCQSVSIALEKMMQFEPFKPDPAVWGEVHSDKSGEGWTDHYYSILIQNGVKLTVYCDADGTVSQNTHIVVGMV